MVCIVLRFKVSRATIRASLFEGMPIMSRAVSHRVTLFFASLIMVAGVFFAVSAFAEAVLTPDPSSFSFGDQQISVESDPVILILTNVGDSVATGITCAVVNRPPFNDPNDPLKFSISTCPISLAGFAAFEIELTFTPIEVGAVGASLQVGYNNGAGWTSIMISLEGNGTETILEPEFDSSPSPGAFFDFGSVRLNVETADQHIDVSNLGGADLTLDCEMIGDFDSFNLKDCTSPIAAASSGLIVVSCESNTVGYKLATIVVYTNDSDENILEYDLSCYPYVPPDEIFFNGFESHLATE